MDYARATLGKHSRPAASASATSRKNKLQRCSVCGGLGHKSRTCDQGSARGTQDLSDPSSSPERRLSPVPEYENSITDARAAYVLLNLSTEKSIDLSVCESPPPLECEPCELPAPVTPVAPIAPIAPITPPPAPPAPPLRTLPPAPRLMVPPHLLPPPPPSVASILSQTSMPLWHQQPYVQYSQYSRQLLMA